MSLSLEEIEKEIERLDKDSKALKKEIYKLAWFMRGSITIEQAFAMSPEDRNIVSEIVQENINTTNETKLPFF